MPAPPVHEQITEAIREQIRSGALSPGQRLPNKQDLADEWQCSVQPVSTALMRLEYEGLVVRRQGVGTFVAEKAGG